MPGTLSLWRQHGGGQIGDSADTPAGMATRRAVAVGVRRTLAARGRLGTEERRALRRLHLGAAVRALRAGVPAEARAAAAEMLALRPDAKHAFAAAALAAAAAGPPAVGRRLAERIARRSAHRFAAGPAG